MDAVHVPTYSPGELALHLVEGKVRSLSQVANATEVKTIGRAEGKCDFGGLHYRPSYFGNPAESNQLSVPTPVGFATPAHTRCAIIGLTVNEAASSPPSQDEIRGLNPLVGDKACHRQSQSTTGAKHCQSVFLIV
ncbi:MAG: hypothetical protein QOJ64_3408 [Acidobacteriota bacterium]|nr:hypothetical protein [Acidobacteriota bacterium]